MTCPPRRAVAFTVLTVLAACLLGVAACDTAVGGDPRIASTPAGSLSRSDARHGTPMMAVSPCDLLDPAGLSGLDTDGAPPTLAVNDGERFCAGKNYRFSITEGNDELHTAAFTGGDVTVLPDLTGHRTTLRQRDLDGVPGCEVAIEVTADEMVKVAIATGAGPSSPCDLAKQAAGLVIGKVP